MRQQSIHKRTGFVMATVAALALAFGATTADAGGYKNKHAGKHHGKHYGKNYGKHYKHNNSAAIVLGTLGVIGWTLHSGNYYDNSPVSYSRRQHRRHKRHYSKHYYASNYGHSYQGHCYPVKKIGYWHGKKAKIGGTACVDAYGDRYVVKGSRYVIRYLY